MPKTKAILPMSESSIDTSIVAQHDSCQQYYKVHCCFDDKIKTQHRNMYNILYDTHRRSLLIRHPTDFRRLLSKLYSTA